MGNEMSRPDNLSPQSSGVVPPRSPYTPTGGSSRRAHSFNMRSPSPSSKSNEDPPPLQRRTSSSSSLESSPVSNPRKERTIQRMDKAIRRRVRGGITYNMKLLIRGAKGTGKTSLFQRLQGEPIPETHLSTPQLQSATIKWNFRQNLEENVRCEVWDVVDKGFVAVDAVNGGEQDATEPQKAAQNVQQGSLHHQGRLSAEAVAAAAAVLQNGTHSMAIVDASSVDVYHEAHGVIFLLDITKWDTLEYVKQQLENVPVHIPTLVLGNFRDQGAQRKIFKEDIQELLYGSSDRSQQQPWRRPSELLYFECSLLNCYGLKSLHQYFGIPFLQLKLATIRQQIRIVEGQFAHLKHDVQTTIVKQRYAEYVELIKTTGSDIRTGRRGSGSGGTPRGAPCSDSAALSSQKASQATLTTQQDSLDNDVSVVNEEVGVGTSPEQAIASITDTPEQENEVTEAQEMEDLPARNSRTVIQSAPTLKLEHKESAASMPVDASDKLGSVVEDKSALHNEQDAETPALMEPSSGRPRRMSMEEVVNLEDFQVPKMRTGELEHFYSEDESDEAAGGSDEDVVVALTHDSMQASTGGVFHKQRFLDSDSSSDEKASADTQRGRREKVPRKSFHHRKATKEANATTDQTALSQRPLSSSPSSSRLSPAASQSMRSKPGSRKQSSSSSFVHPSQDEPCEKLPQQPQPLSDVAVNPNAQPASTSASPSRQSRPKSEGRSIVAPITHALRTQDESEVKDKSFLSEAPESSGLEEPINPSRYASPQKPINQESLKNSNHETHSFTEGVSDNKVTSPASASKDKEMSADASPLHDALDHDDINSELENDVHAPTDDQAKYPIKWEIVGRPGSPNGTDTIITHDEDGGYDGIAAAASQTAEDVPLDLAAPSSPQLSEVRTNEDESDGDASNPNDSTKKSAPKSLSVGIKSANSQRLEGTKGHYHKRNVDQRDDLVSLSALHASLPLPEEASLTSSAPYENTKRPTDSVDESKTNAPLQVSDFPTMSSTCKSVVPDFATVFPSNDLEAFLNESGSDLEETSSPAGLAERSERSKQPRSDARVVMESSDDDDEEYDQERFASYSISKKKRSERRRQQKEDLRQLNAALEIVNDPFAPSPSTVTVTDTSFGTSDVMEAIRKAQEEAVRMLSTSSTCPLVHPNSDMINKRHTHRHKKEDTRKKDEHRSKKAPKKSNRKSGTNSRSKKRSPRVDEDIA